MTDIVEQLRAYRMDVDSPDVVLEAADEIERLRRQVDALREFAYNLCGDAGQTDLLVQIVGRDWR